MAAIRNRQGCPVQIIYDPENITRVHLGGKGPASLNPTALLLLGLGGIFIAAGLYNVLFDLGIPMTKPRDRRPAS